MAVNHNTIIDPGIEGVGNLKIKNRYHISIYLSIEEIRIRLRDRLCASELWSYFDRISKSKSDNKLVLVLGVPHLPHPPLTRNRIGWKPITKSERESHFIRPVVSVSETTNFRYRYLVPTKIKYVTVEDRSRAACILSCFRICKYCLEKNKKQKKTIMGMKISFSKNTRLLRHTTSIKV